MRPILSISYKHHSGRKRKKDEKEFCNKILRSERASRLLVRIASVQINCRKWAFLLLGYINPTVELCPRASRFIAQGRGARSGNERLKQYNCGV